MGLRRWLDQLLGRGDDRTEGAAVTATAQKQQEEARKPPSEHDVDEGVHAAKDEAWRDLPMPPPGTGL